MNKYRVVYKGNGAKIALETMAEDINGAAEATWKLLSPEQQSRFTEVNVIGPGEETGFQAIQYEQAADPNDKPEAPAADPAEEVEADHAEDVAEIPAAVEAEETRQDEETESKE